MNESALVFDLGLLATAALLLVLLSTSLARPSRTRGASRRRQFAAPLMGLAILTAMHGTDVWHAALGTDREMYANVSTFWFVVALAAITIIGLAVFDALSLRGEQLAQRIAPRLEPWLTSILILGGALVASIGLSIVGTTTNDATAAAPEPTTTTTTTQPTRRPTTILLSATSDDSEGSRIPTPDLVLSAITDPGDLEFPTFLTSPPEDARLFVIERAGRVRVIEDGQLRQDPIIDLTDDVRPSSDGGLIGLAFHPDFATNGRMFLHYTDLNDDNRIVEYRLDPATAVLADASPRDLLHVEQPTDFHAGGMLQFGPDGYLYIAIGEGGAFGIGELANERDPRRVAQDPDVLLGGILRIDADHGNPYAIPPENGFAGREANETFAYGLRNPYRFWIDSQTSRMFIGDVGQVTWEEVNMLDLGEPGLNFGWDTTEGSGCYLLSGEFVATCDRTGLTQPILSYRNFRANPPGATGTGCAVIMGPQYRGLAMPELDGVVLYTDFCSSWIGGLDIENGAVSDTVLWEPEGGLALGTPISFGIDASGEIYLLTAADGLIYRITSS